MKKKTRSQIFAITNFRDHKFLQAQIVATFGISFKIQRRLHRTRHDKFSQLVTINPSTARQMSPERTTSNMPTTQQPPMYNNNRRTSEISKRQKEHHNPESFPAFFCTNVYPSKMKPVLKITRRGYCILIT